MKLAARPVLARRRNGTEPARCHPLLRRGGLDLDRALLNMHAVQEMPDFWDAAPLSMPMFLIRLEDNRVAPANGAAEKASAMGLLGRLSPREREVAQLVGQGLSNDEVAQRLRKSVLTVKRQLRSIYEKLNVTSRGRLTALLR